MVNLDVAQEVGSATALVKNIPVTVTDGKLNIDFSATVNRPMVCGVEVYSFNIGSDLMSVRTNSDSSLLLLRNARPVSINVPDGSLKVYPNPFKNKFTIIFPSSYAGNYELQIIDVIGRTYDLGKTSVRAGGSIENVDVSKYALKAGVYFLSISSESNKKEILKLLVE